ncbi:MAG: WXG100 family type VII secretion target [Janibacter sp.]
MSQFTVNTESIAGSATDISRISEEVESSVSQMMTRLTQLQSEWTGAASGSFQELLSDWRATQRQVKESLDDISRVLGEAGQTYSTTEDGVKSTITGGSRR